MEKGCAGESILPKPWMDATGDPHEWTPPKEAVVLFVTTKRRSCPLMPQFTNGHSLFPFHTALARDIFPIIEVSPEHVHDVRHLLKTQRPGPASSTSLPAFRIPT